MQDLIRFIRTTGIYLVGNVLTKLIAFLLLPIYTGYLSPAEYGTYDLNIAYITFLSSILFLDIWGGIMRFMFDYKDDSDKAQVVKSGATIFLISTLIYTLAVVILGTLLGVEYKFLLFLYGLLTNLQQVMGFTSRGFGKNKIFAISGVVTSFVTIVCNIIFIVVFRQGYYSLYISSCIGLLVGIIILGQNINVVQILRACKINKTLLREMLIYSLPLSVNSAAYWFLASFNKVLISYRLSVEENGMYAVANKFTSMISLFTQCFQMAWQELTFSKAGKSKSEMDLFYTTAFKEYIRFMSFIASIKICFPILISSSYNGAENLVPIAILAALFSCFSSFLGSILSTLKKNKYIFTTTIVGSTVNVLIAVFLINILGVQAANIALAIGYLVIDIRRFLMIKKDICILLDWKWIGALSIQLIITCIVYIKLNSIWSGIVILLLCCELVIVYRDKIQKLYIKRER